MVAEGISREVGLDTAPGSDIVWSPRRLHGLRREIGRPWKPVEGAEACYRAEFLVRTLTGPIGVARSMGPRRLVRRDLSEVGALNFADSGLLDELGVELGIL